jgi:hypothetical protein
MKGIERPTLRLNVLWLYRLLSGAPHAKDMNNVITDDEQRSIGSSLLGSKEHATHVFRKLL